MEIKTNTRSFAGGEVTPEFWGRIDDAKYQTGLATCRNFLVRPHGPVANRPGFAFVREVQDSDRRTRLIPFNYSTTQTMVIELGHLYARFHTEGATLLQGSPAAYDGGTDYEIGDLVSYSGANYYCIQASTGNLPTNATYWYAQPASGVYEIPTPYIESHLFDLHYVQSADVLTITHPSYLPRELRRLGAVQWVLSQINFASLLSPPDNVVATATLSTNPSPAVTYTYVVSTVGQNTADESTYSAIATCNNQLLDDGVFNTITWDAVTGASRYYVYKLSNGLYGYIGQTAGLSFVDDNIAADVSVTPPEINDPFLGAGNYPAAVSYFEQRRLFAGTINAPQTLWGTRSGTESNLNYSIPTRDDDSIQFRIAAREANTIRHIVPLQELVLLTNSAEWRVTSVNTDAITPTSLSVKPQSYIGANNVPPVIVNNNLIFAANRGGHVREMGYSSAVGGYLTGDLSLRAPHLFDNLDVVDMAFSKAPQQIVWAVSSNGNLLGLTYVPEHAIGAWHQHDTQGEFESCCVVAEGNEDYLYVVVKRNIDGNDVRYIERMASRQFASAEDAFFVDSGLTYDGAATNTLSGLDHLEGETVSVLADGAVLTQKTVTSGAITLEVEASKIHVGLPITADMRTLPLAFEIEGYGQGRTKNVNKVWLRVFESSGIFAGPSLDDLREYKQRTTEVYGSPPELKTKEVSVVLTPTWGDSGSIYVRQSDPLPLTVVSMSLEVSIGT